MKLPDLPPFLKTTTIPPPPVAVASFPPPLQVVSLKSSAVKAGWICLILGLCTFWIFGIGFAFFSVTMILSVVAMCTNQVRSGVLLLVSSLASLAFCMVLYVFFVLGTFGAVAGVMLGAQKQKLDAAQSLRLPEPDKIRVVKDPFSVKSQKKP